MGEIVRIDGPIVTVRVEDVKNGEQVRLGSLGLVGEVIALQAGSAMVQCYEATEGLRPGDSVSPQGHPLSVELGPGLIGGIFDGVQRPLESVRGSSGDRIARGIDVPSLDRERRWSFTPAEGLEPGERVRAGQCLGSVPETESVAHRVLVPPLVAGELLDLARAGDYRVDETVAQVRDASGHVHRLALMHRWPVRIPRPFARRDNAAHPLITGQRVLDTFFPVLKGGRAAVPGPFGAGKTVVQQQIARWANADIVLYVGCGERGNELVEILEDFPKLTDPTTGRSLMERTLIVANTSNMPVVAREASIYVGVTIAEYYRDQGFDVVMVADSTSRWAEALREVSGRLGHMPVEEGYPAYLASRLAAFYERAGRVEALGGETGSVTLIGAVSPPGGDFSEPVTTHTKDLVGTFWALSKPLADARHYPAIDWHESFSGYIDTAATWWHEAVSAEWLRRRAEALALLTQADELQRIVNLVGPEALSSEQQWALEAAALVREGVLQQSALDDKDSYCSPAKQFLILDLLLDLYHHGRDIVALGAPSRELAELAVVPRAKRLKSAFASEELAALGAFRDEVRAAFDELRVRYAGAITEAS